MEPIGATEHEQPKLPFGRGVVTVGEHMPESPSVPAEIRRLEDAEIRITWTDGHVGTYPNRYLRAACQCAQCRGAQTAVNIADDIRALEIEPVGRYAIGIRWSDGHGTGIYTWSLLREICPCSVCESGGGGCGHVRPR